MNINQKVPKNKFVGKSENIALTLTDKIELNKILTIKWTQKIKYLQNMLNNVHVVNEIL